MDQATKKPCFYFAVAILILGLVWAFQINNTKEKYANYKLVSYDHYLPNKNAFGNYYRVGYELGQNMGWKPSETWDHLRPESNETPGCWHTDAIYHY